jgi:multiple antibiotic resistance protein
MDNPFAPYILTFIQIFVAVDAIGNIPVFVSLVEGTTKKQRGKIIAESITTATVVSILFMLGGKWVLRFIGVTIPDFQIAGGVLLFVISLRLLLPGSTRSFLSDGHGKGVGVFPLGTPLITGPAVLTTTVIMLDTFGIWPTFVSLVINMVIVWASLVKADAIMRVMGVSGTRAFSKIMYILLAAIGVMMVRRGITGILMP